MGIFELPDKELKMYSMSQRIQIENEMKLDKQFMNKIIISTKK